LLVAVRPSGRPGTTRPSRIFELTPAVEQLLSRAYIPLLTQLVDVFANGLQARQVDSTRTSSARQQRAEYVASLKSAWETLFLLANGIKPTRAGSGKRVSNRKALAQIDLHWHDLRHEALSRLADDGVPVHELQLLAGHSSITTTQRYMNARASSLAESMRQARERRVNRVEHADEATAQIG